MTTETAGIREIDTGTLPDRFARGWHCLGPVSDYLDGKPHGVEIFGTMLVVFADSHGDIKILDGYCRHMGGNLSQGTIKGDEVSFQVTREFNGNKVVIKYNGKVSGDTIKGKSESQRDGQPQTRDWVARKEATAK